MSKGLFSEVFGVCVGELRAALKAMKPLGKEWSGVRFTPGHVEGFGAGRGVRVRLHWVDGGPSSEVRVDRLCLLSFLEGAPDGAQILFEQEMGGSGLRAVVPKHGVELRTLLPEGLDGEQGQAQWEQEEELTLDAVGAAAFFRVAAYVGGGDRYAMACVRLAPMVAEVRMAATNGVVARTEEVRLVGGPVYHETQVSVPPLLVEVLEKWGRADESPLTFGWSKPTMDSGKASGRWVKASCGGLEVWQWVSVDADEFPKVGAVVSLAKEGKLWRWRLPRSERMRLLDLVKVMPPDSWDKGRRVLSLACDPGVTSKVSGLLLEMGGNVVPVRAELLDEPEEAEGTEVCLDPANFLAALASGVEVLWLHDGEHKGPVLFTAEGVAHLMQPLILAGDEAEEAAGEDASATKQPEGGGATVTISTPGMAPVTLTEETFEKLSRGRRRLGKQAAEAGEEGLVGV